MTKTLTPEIRTKIDEWQKIATWLNKWSRQAKAREQELREEIIRYFFENKLEEGVNRHTTIDGFEIKVNQPFERKVDRSTIQAVLANMPAEYQPEGVLIRWVPEIVMDGYRKLRMEDFKKFSEAYTETQGTPSLSIETMDIPKVPPPPNIPSSSGVVSGLASQTWTPAAVAAAPIQQVEAPKKRGRKSGSGGKPVAGADQPRGGRHSAAAGSANPVKRGRGRPPGSKNKK